MDADTQKDDRQGMNTKNELPGNRAKKKNTKRVGQTSEKGSRSEVLSWILGQLGPGKGRLQFKMGQKGFKLEFPALRALLGFWRKEGAENTGEQK